MAANIGSLAAILTINSSRFNKGLTKAGRMAVQFGSVIRKVGSAVAKLGAIMVGVATAGMSVLIRRASETIHQLSIVSDRLGISSKALSGFHFAAKIAGIETNTFNMALQRMTRRISEAAIGTGEAKDAIKELGINAAIINKLPLDERLKVVADALSKVNLQSDRVRRAFKLFDSEGVALLTMLQNGRGELEKFQKIADDLGVTIDDAGTKKIHLMKAAMFKAWSVLQGMANTILLELSPYITELAEKFVDWASKSARSVRFVKSMIMELKVAIAKLREAVQAIKRRFLNMLYLIAKQISKVADQISYLFQLRGIVLGKLGDKAAVAQAKAVEVVAAKLRELRDELGQMTAKAVGKNMYLSTLEYFLKIKRKWASIAAGMVTDKAAPPSTATADTGRAGFAQIVRSRTAFGTGGKRNKVPIIGDPRQTQLLQEIALVLHGAQVARAY